MGNIHFKNISQRKSSDEQDLISLLAELNQIIPLFVHSAIFRRDIFDKSDENHYTETLIKYFANENPDNRFWYMNQPSLPSRRSTDIGVYLKADSEHYIFCIEAKYLPPKDYVTGEYAAIKRFKKREHGLSNRNPQKAKKLSQSAIVGYATSGRFEEHLTKINSQIKKSAASNSEDSFGLRWEETEQLQKSNWTTNDFASSYSSHLCVDGSMIKLHHFWVEVHPPV